MALSKKKTITIALALADDRLLSRAARERGVLRSEFIRQHVARALEQYRRRPKPTSAGIVRALTERGDVRDRRPFTQLLSGAGELRRIGIAPSTTWRILLSFLRAIPQV